MLTAQLAKRYAKALFEVASEEKQLDAFGAQLAELHETIADHAELEKFINNPRVKKEAKKDLVRKLFEKQLSPFVYNFLRLLIDKRRENILQGVLAEYKNLANAAQNIVPAEVTVAHPLVKKQETQLIEKLKTITGKDVVIETKVDQSILGGVIVRIGDKLIDGSVTRQLETLQKQLLAN